MPQRSQKIKNYYGRSGGYLRDHAEFLRSADIEKDLGFLIKALSIKKSDAVLDVACGQGRHANALARKGYAVDGVDFSAYLLKKAKEAAVQSQEYIKADVENLKLAKKYDKAYWFFSDLANINMPKAIVSISRNLKKGGKALFDTDNIFRVVSRLMRTPDPNLTFDAKSLMLTEKDSGVSVPYPVLPMWNMWLGNAGLRTELILGDYNFEEYSIHSPRLILVVKK